MKKLFSIVLAIAMAATLLIPPAAVNAAGYNYVDAFSKSIRYFEASWCGTDAGNNRLNWRGPCHTTEGSDVGLDLTGGFHDAGDHVKFGHPQGYAGSVLNWTLYEYKDTLTQTGQYNYLYNICKHFAEYFIKCHPNANTFYYQIGDGDTDHAYWGPPELQPTVMPAYGVCTPSKPATQMCADAAAALALMYLNAKDTDPTFASTCLTKAQSLYVLGKTYLGNGTGQSYYGSGPYWDELCWGAIWLYYATNNSSYLTDINSFMVSAFGSSSNLSYMNNWTMCWDDMWAAVFIKMYQITGTQVYKDNIEYNLSYWMNNIAKTPGGLRYLNSWGVLRYAEAEAAIALIYSQISGNTTYRDFAKTQVDYALGTNPRNASYVVGFGTGYPLFPHHRAASGRLEGPPADEKKQMPEKHVLYGALVGGPKNDDSYVDDVEQYMYTEVAIDYNAGFVMAMAGMSKNFGAGQTPEVIPAEPDVKEFYAEAKVMGETNQEVKIDIYVHNETIHPPRYDSGLSLRYFVDLSEFYAKGYTVSNVNVTSTYNPNSATYTQLKAWDAAKNIYYTDISWVGKNIYGKSEFQLGLTSYGINVMDSSNDYSRTGLNTTSFATSDYIPVYRNGVKIAGNEPGGSTPTPTPSTVTPTATPSTATPTPTPSTVTPTATPSTATPTATPSTATPTPTPSTATPTPTPSTATPTPTPSTATPTPTPTAGTPTPGGIKVQFFNGNTAASTNTIYPNFKLVNTGTAAITLSTVKMRYYFTNDGTAANSFACDYASAGSGNITSAFATTTGTNADRYLEVGFTGAAGTLGAGAGTEVKGRLWKSDWSNFTQTNDYSFNSTATNYVDWTKVTGYVNGVQAWGTQP